MVRCGVACAPPRTRVSIAFPPAWWPCLPNHNATGPTPHLPPRPFVASRFSFCLPHTAGATPYPCRLHTCLITRARYTHLVGDSSPRYYLTTFWTAPRMPPYPMHGLLRAARHTHHIPLPLPITTNERATTGLNLVTLPHTHHYIQLPATSTCRAPTFLLPSGWRAGFNRLLNSVPVRIALFCEGPQPVPTRRRNRLPHAQTMGEGGRPGRRCEPCWDPSWTCRVWRVMVMP